MAIDEICAAGFDAMDLTLVPDLCDHFDAARQSAAERQDFATLIRNSPLLVPTVTTSFQAQQFPFLDQSTLAPLKLAAQLSSKALNLVCGAAASSWAEGLRGIARTASQLSLNINLWPRHPCDAQALLEQAGEDNVMLLLDLEALWRARINPVEMIRKLTGRIGHVRLPEKADMDLPAVFRELARTGYEGCCSLDLDFGADPACGRRRLRESRRLALAQFDGVTAGDH